MVANRCNKVLTAAAVAVSALSTMALAKPDQASCCPAGTVQCGYECLEPSLKAQAKSMGMHCDQDAPPDAPCLDPDTPPEGCCEVDAVCCDGVCVEPSILEPGFFGDPDMICGDAACCDVSMQLSADSPLAGFPVEAPVAAFEFEFEGDDICCGEDMFCCDGVCLDAADAAFTTCPLEGVGCCVGKDDVTNDDGTKGNNHGVVSVDANADATGGGSAVATATVTSTDPPPDPQPASKSSPTSGGGEGSGGSSGEEFTLCIPNGSKTYGPTVAQREFPNQGSAVTITSSGMCSWEEYAGGFDGFPSPEIGDGHEEGMDMAIEQMFPGDHAKQTAFLQAMIDIAKPVDMDFPEDEARADGGERMKNIHKLDAACSQLISISC